MEIKVIEDVKDMTTENSTATFTLSDVDIKEIDGQIWFCANDVAKAIEYDTNHIANWYKWIDEDEILTTQNERSTAKNKNMKYLSESALYRVLIKTDVPKAKPFERWITREVIPSIRKTGKYEVKEERKPYQPSEYEEKLLKMETAKLWKTLGDDYSGASNTFKGICYTYSANTLAGTTAIALPTSDKKTYSATEVKQMLKDRYNIDVSIQKLGAIANDNELKDRDNINGEWHWDKSRYSNKEIESFRYYEDAVEKFANLLRKVS